MAAFDPALPGCIRPAADTWSVAYDYETDRDLRTSVAAGWYGTSLAEFDYTYDQVGRRKWVEQSGAAFADLYQGTVAHSIFTRFGYDSRGQLNSVRAFPGTESPAEAEDDADLPGRHVEYRFDAAGNRTSSGIYGSSVDEEDHDGDDAYVPNGLNQFDSRTNKSVTVSGSAAFAARMAVRGYGRAAKNGPVWAAELTPPNESGPVQREIGAYATILGGGPGGSDLLRSIAMGNDPRRYFVAAREQDFQHDLDGNLTSDGVWDYSYDAENRLARMQSTLPAGFGFKRLLLDFKYDYLGRRVQKRAINLETFAEESLTRYVYAGWSLIAETSEAGEIQRSYTWGLDVAGSFSATGGVGALLQITHHNVSQRTDYLIAYDGGGNVMVLKKAETTSGTALAAVYEYSAFGERLRREILETSDTAVAGNAFGFSTKYTDAETDLVYYGLRYYAPSMGRFFNRDPLGEDGGNNLYGFSGNDPINRGDLLGLDVFGFKTGTDYRDYIDGINYRHSDYHIINNTPISGGPMVERTAEFWNSVTHGDADGNHMVGPLNKVITSSQTSAILGYAPANGSGGGAVLNPNAFSLVSGGAFLDEAIDYHRKQLLVAIDGTNSGKWRKEIGADGLTNSLVHNMVNTFARASNGPFMYLDGPNTFGTDAMDIAGEALAFIHNQLIKNSNLSINLIGHSRGAMIAIFIANALKLGFFDVNGGASIRVAFLGLFDAVDRTAGMDASRISNVDNVLHIVRDPSGRSRVLFGNTGRRADPDVSYVEKILLGTHSAIGGDPGHRDFARTNISMIQENKASREADDWMRIYARLSGLPF